MKRIFLFLLMGVFAGFQVNAQKDLKIGHINSVSLVQTMPEFTQAQKELQKHAKDLEQALGEMQTELQNKYQAYTAKADSLSPLLKKAKEEEITELQKRIESFRSSAQDDLRKKESELQQPIIEKVQKAINDVASENGFTYILNSADGGPVLYTSPSSIDITSLVKKKLGMK